MTKKEPLIVRRPHFENPCSILPLWSQHWFVAHSMLQLSPSHISAAWGLRCRLLSVPLPLQAVSDGVRAGLHALLATKDVPVAMELHACRHHRVNSTINTGKHSLDTEAQAQPWSHVSGTDIRTVLKSLSTRECMGFWFQVPLREYHRDKKLIVVMA